MRKLKNIELERLSAEDYKLSKKSPIVIVLDNVRSLNNIGSAFRTADAFLVEAIYLCGICATPPHPEINKTALGAQNSVPWKYFKTAAEALTELRENGYKLYAIEQADERLFLDDFQPADSERMALIFGNEVKGVSDEAMAMVDACIEIPQFGTKHSFNISVSIGIVLWDLCQKMKRSA